MEEQPRPDPDPDPEPQPQAQAQPSEQSQTSGAARGEPPRRSSGEAYTDRPEFHARRRSWWPLAVALAVAIGVGGVALRRASPPIAQPIPPQIGTVLPAGIGTQTLLYSAKDYDAATTQAARAELASGKKLVQLPALPVAQRPGAPLIAPDSGLPPAAAMTAAVTAESAPTLEAQALRELAVAPQALRDQVASGRAGFYTFHLAELADEGGDVYDIAVDGAPLLRVTTSRELTAITIPMDVSRPHTVTQTLVFARPRGVYVLGPANGSAPPPPANLTSFSVRTSVGEARSHMSSAGESQTWNAQFSGAP